MLHDERVALQDIFELDCAEESFIEVMDSKNPIVVAAGICFLFRHMGSWSHSMLAGMTLDRMDAEASLEVSSAPLAGCTDQSS